MHRQLHRGAESGLGQHVSPGFAVHPADHLVGVGLVQAGTQPIEDRQRGLRIAPGPLVLLAGQVDFGMVQEPEPLEMYVADPLRYLKTLLEVSVGVVPQFTVGADHAQVVEGNGAAPLVAAALERGQGALVVTQCLGQTALDVRQNPEILFRASPQLRTGTTELQRLVEALPGSLDLSALEVETG